MKKWLLILGLSHLALGQAVSYHSNVTQTAGNVPPGASAPVMTTPNALVTICTYPPTGTPCTNTVAVFQDQAMSNPYTQPLNADPKGRFDLWAPAGQYYVSVQTQSGVNVGGYPLTLGGAGGGGGGNPGGVPSNAQYQINSTTFGGSAATLDAAGNSKTLSNDGLRNAFLNQSSSGSNNGIQNSLQTSENFVMVGPDYPCVEGTYSSSPNYRLGFGVPAPFANGTQLFDNRNCTTIGSYLYNPNLPVNGGTFRYDRIISNQQAQSSGNGNLFEPLLLGFEVSGSGKNGFDGGGPDSFSYSDLLTDYMRRGIGSVLRHHGNFFGLGDTQLQNNTESVNRGSTDGSGEGFQIIRNDVTQNRGPTVATANSNLAAGATVIAGTRTSTNNFIGDGTYYIDATRGGSTFHIVGLTNPGVGCNAGTWTVDSTLTPDNIGCSSATVSTPKQYYGATTAETFTVTGLAHAVCGGIQAWNGSACVDTSGPAIQATACVADAIYQESAHVESAGAWSGGTQTITVDLRYTHGPNFYVSQGSHACNLVEDKANQLPGALPGRELFRVIGASGAHTYLYSRTVFGGWHPAPTGFFSVTPVAAAGVTLTRTSNVTTVAVSDSFQLFTGNAIIVSGCTDPSFNGSSFTLASDTGTAVTWPNPGSNGTTTCTSPIELISRMSGLGVREAQEFPGAEIVDTNDPTTFALNYNISVEPNTNLHVSSGDVMENHVYSDVVMQLDHSRVDFQTQNAPLGQPLHQDQISGEIPEGTIYQSTAFTDFPIHYQGLGGTKPISNTLYDYANNTAPFANLWNLLPPPSRTAFSFNGCLYGCTDSRSNFQLFSAPMNNGSWTETINQGQGFIRSELNNSTTGSDMTRTESPTIFQVFTSQTGPLGAVFTVIPGNLTSRITTGGSVESHLIQTPTSASFDAPFQFVPHTFAALPACSSGIEGSEAAITDGSVNTWGSTVAGSGTNHVLAYCDGTNWTVMGK